MNISQFCFLETVVKFNVVDGRHREMQLTLLVTFNTEDIFHFIFFRNFKLLYDVKTIVHCHVTHLKKAEQRESTGNFMSCVPLHCSKMG